MTPPGTAPGRRWLLLLALPPLSLVMQARQEAAAPRPDDLRCAALAVDRGWADGDVVRFEPTWSMSAWPLLRSRPVDEAPALAPAGLRRYSRAWILATHGARGRTDWPEGVREDARQECGAVEVVRISLPSP